MRPTLAKGRGPRQLSGAGVTLALLLSLPGRTEPVTFRPSRGHACPPRGADATYNATVEAAVAEVAAVWPLPASLVKAVIQRESAFRPDALSSAGAVGLMQVLRSNARLLGFTPDGLWAPDNNIRAGTRLLAILLKHYQGDVISALVAYNARPRRRLAPLPENSETPAYVRAVLRFWAIFARCDVPQAGVGPVQSPHRTVRILGAPGTAPA